MRASTDETPNPIGQHHLAVMGILEIVMPHFIFPNALVSARVIHVSLRCFSHFVEGILRVLEGFSLTGLVLEAEAAQQNKAGYPLEFTMPMKNTSNKGLTDPVFVTQPTMPPLEEFTQLMGELWEKKWLTNDGAFHKDLEVRIATYLDVENMSMFCNGTLALMIALHMLRLNSGEIITTPFTFPATPHVLYWNGIRPVFCDIDPKTYNLDPKRIEELITTDTCAIMPVHVYGTPCDVDAIQAIADRHGLPVIYDAAHSFGAKFRGKAICSYGDAAILSFHATKLFSTGEGGAIIVKTKAQKERVNFLKNFGFADQETIIGPGINGKMNEFQAAFGLLQLKRIDNEIANRRKIDRIYRERLSELPGISLLKEAFNTERNYAYFPILINEDQYGISRDTLYDKLKEYNILARKYFYPLCSQYPCYASLPSSRPENLPVAERVSRQVLCLPIYGTLDHETAERIATMVVQLGANTNQRETP
jgi:dTDP-4-amino-4,6-dideoxygalactose transaminase